jgi:ABC-type transport system substrate-binding protein
MKKSISILVAGTMTLGLLSGCGSAFDTGSTATTGDTSTGASATTASAETALGGNYLRIPESSEFSTLDCQKDTEFYCVPLNIYDSLLDCQTVDGKATLEPDLAKSWDVSDDGLVYTFHLQEGVKFHNGNDFTAEDVEYTIDRMMNPETQAVNTDFFNMIQGATDRYEGKADSVSGVKVIDDYTVQITLEKPFAPFLANLATPSCSIYDKDATEAAGDKFGIDPSVTVGTGPFKVVSWTLNDKIVLEKNPDYFRGAPKVDGIELIQVPDDDTQKLMYENGELDIVDLSSSASNLQYFLSNDKYKDKLVTGPEAGEWFYFFNVNEKPTDDVRVRKAIQYAIDRQTILDQLYSGQGVVINSMLPNGFEGSYDAAEIAYDPDKSKQLLADAGYADGCDITLYQTTDSPATLALNQIVQSMLETVGFKVTITQLDDAAFTAQRKDGKIGFAKSSWWADYNDPDNFLYTFFSTKNASVRSNNYANTEVQQELEDARAETDSTKRMQMYAEIDTAIVQDDAIVLPLFQFTHIVAVQDWVKNFTVPWNGWTDTCYRNVEIDR